MYALMLIPHFGEFMFNATIMLPEIKSTCRILCTVFKLSSCLGRRLLHSPSLVQVHIYIATVIARSCFIAQTVKAPIDGGGS